MPTSPPEPVQEPKTIEAKLERDYFAANMDAFFRRLDGYIYSCRSYPPCGFDATEIMGKINDVKKLCKERPDWVVSCWTGRGFHQFDG